MMFTNHSSNQTRFAVTMILVFGVSSGAIQAQEERDAEVSSSSLSNDLDLRWIDAELSLIATNLNFVLDVNKRSPGTYSDVFAEELRLRSKLFKAWREQVVSDQPNFVAIDIEKARGDLRIARMRLAEDEEVRARAPAAVREIEIKKRKLAVEAAEIWLEKVSDPSFAKLSKHERTQWRMIILGKDILETRIEFKR